MADETENKVLSIIANITDSQNSNSNASEMIDHEKVQRTNANTKTVSLVKGKPKSGRFWKSDRERFSSINKTKGLRQNLEKKNALRFELKRTKELSKQVLAEIKDKEQKRKERRKENIRKSEENKRKSEVVQVITNTAKLKRMRKKQLRFIEKRDTNKDVQANKEFK
ncbi:hypothetical protein K1T71_011168 [Dendrolimus kikuchii]|uniref:Uncharacterized protein n=1 Tax=Dendrolimus kikuchii TaxID=765133 RepID=A0ACC1CNE4_9NEOP|nr:hypothetical protein K1T71_011168 [Dendrolimus kikuchii]